MALIEYDAYKQKLNALEPELTKLSAALDIESAKQEAARLEEETAQDGFWNDLARSQKVQKMCIRDSLYIVAPKIFAVNGRGWRSSTLPEGADLVTSIEGV